MQSRIIRQSPGHKTDRQTTEGLGENRPRGRPILVPGARLETAKQTNKQFKALLEYWTLTPGEN